METTLKNILLDQLNCRDCWGKDIILETPFNPPRGWACNDDRSQVKILVVSLNPGHPLPEEIERFKNKQESVLDEDDLQFLMDFATNVYKRYSSRYGGSSVFHNKLRSYIQEALINCGIIDRHDTNDWFKYVWLTDIFKCSTVNESGPNISAYFMNHCIQRHLLKELNYFNPKAIIAMGTRAYKGLIKTKWASRTVYFRHPANGGPRINTPTFRNQLEKLLITYKKINIERVIL